jgi:hypothetical protein
MNSPVKVVCLDGEAGWLKEVIIDPATGQPTRFILQLPGDSHAEVLISTRLVMDFKEDVIQLDTTVEALEELSEYQILER